MPGQEGVQQSGRVCAASGMKRLVAAILEAVCAAVTIPVTLKIRLGWSPQEQNAETIAQIAESAGIQALTVHGRTRACRFQGEVDYAAIARVKAKVSIPVIGNGDITNAQQASSVLQNTGVDAVMLGRAVQGRPWLPADIDRFLTTGLPPVERSFETKCRALARHVRALHLHYGPEQGLRIARKHVGWFLQANTLDSEPFRQTFNLIQCDVQQLVFLDRLWTSARSVRRHEPGRGGQSSRPVRPGEYQVCRGRHHQRLFAIA